MKKGGIALYATLLLLVSLLFVLLAPLCFAHPGDTDDNGGHYDRSTGEYHYHHGYPAHQHPNGECPYYFNDNRSEYSPEGNKICDFIEDCVKRIEFYWAILVGLFLLLGFILCAIMSLIDKLKEIIMSKRIGKNFRKNYLLLFEQLGIDAKVPKYSSELIKAYQNFINGDDTELKKFANWLSGDIVQERVDDALIERIGEFSRNNVTRVLYEELEKLAVDETVGHDALDDTLSREKAFNIFTEMLGGAINYRNHYEYREKIDEAAQKQNYTYIREIARELSATIEKDKISKVLYEQIGEFTPENIENALYEELIKIAKCPWW